MKFKAGFIILLAVGLTFVHLFGFSKGLLSGEVLAVNDEFSFIIIDLGKKDGVKKGEKFIVYKDEKYKGKVEVEEVFKDMCSCNILPEYQITEIKVGDKVIED